MKWMNVRIFVPCLALAASASCGNSPDPSLIGGASAAPAGSAPSQSPIPQPKPGSPADEGPGLSKEEAAERYAWVTVSWPSAAPESAVDLNLHVVDPEGNHFYFLNTGGSSERARFTPHPECPSFDCNGSEENPRESVHWELEDLLEGTYQVWVSNSSDRSGSFDLEVVARDQRINESGSAGANGESRRWSFTVGEEEADPNSPCLTQLQQLGVDFQETTINEGGACQVEDAVMVNSPLNGITYRYIAATSTTRFRTACRTALALHRMGDILRGQGIDEVLHNGSYECKNINGSSTPSTHSQGLAMDFNVFRGGGTEYSVVKHWEHDTDDPQTVEGQVLYSVAHAAADQGVFNLVLTPNFNSDHDDHFHMDLGNGSSGVRMGAFSSTSSIDSGGSCGHD